MELVRCLKLQSPKTVRTKDFSRPTIDSTNMSITKIYTTGDSFQFPNSYNWVKIHVHVFKSQIPLQFSTFCLNIYTSSLSKSFVALHPTKQQLRSCREVAIIKGTSTQHWDVKTCKMCNKIKPSMYCKQLKVMICMDGLTKPLFLGRK